MLKSLIEDLQNSEERNLLKFFQQRLRNRDDAADATQETFLKFLTAPATTSIENPRGYLFQIAANISLNVLARRKRHNARFTDEAEGEFVADGAANPEQIVDARQRLAVLEKAISELPPRCREVFYLSRIGGLSNNEIAAKLDISRNMVEKHIIKALIHCRARRGDLF